MNLTNADVEEIVAILDSTPHDELRLKTDRFELHLKRTREGWMQETHTFGRAAEAAPVSAGPARENEEIEGLSSIRSPMVGTFYRAPKPGAPPFVEIGGEIDEHTVVGVIETMKLMNSIPAGVAGTIVEILVDDGRFVEAGQVLMRVRA